MKIEERNDEMANFYAPKEEKINVITHAIGIGFGLIVLILLMISGIMSGNLSAIVGFAIYGICIIIMYLSSTIYHYVKGLRIKTKLRVLDHTSIFIFIAGTYTPICLLALEGNWRFVILGIIWVLAIVGILLKLFSFYYASLNKTEIVSLFLYIAMGWISVLLLKQLYENIGWQFIMFILLGGIIYSVGVYFYKQEKIKYNHAIWHMIILVASIVQFLGIAIYLA